jgi:hypothetical protein
MVRLVGTEAGWGPMMKRNLFSSDVIGPGCVSIVAKRAGSSGKSDNVNSQETESLKVHYADNRWFNNFTKPQTGGLI